jgi:2,3-bisphosphoglycerate-dependent phosphoglycerate mutase
MHNKFSLYLVRHGESVGNINKVLHKEMADHAIPLSEEGKQQAYEAGLKLAETLLNETPVQGPVKLENGKEVTLPVPPVRLWVSPYTRTRETADFLQKGISEYLNRSGHDPVKLSNLTFDRREHINLVEQQFGLFDGIDDEDLPKLFPNEYAHYKKQEAFEGKFWATMPMGESRYTVALRVHEAFGTFHRDLASKHINRLVIVSHGVTLRAFTMQWLHLPYEWMEKERNPNNCSIRHISDHTDNGYIFAGFEKKK